MKKGLTFAAVFFFLISGQFISGQTKLSIQGGIAFPAGNFNQVANNGFGVCGTIEFPQDENLYITGSAAYYSWGPYTAYYMGPADSYSNFQVMLGIRYLFPSPNVHPYLGVELGMNSMTYTHSVPFAGTSTIYESSTTKLGIAPMFGAIVKINNRLNFDVNLKYNVAPSEAVYNVTYPSTFFALNAGFEFTL